MRVLADANIEAAVVRWLESIGCDVLWAAELTPATPDATLIEIAQDEGRVLLTYDRDFGELIFHRGQSSCGVV